MRLALSLGYFGSDRPVAAQAADALALVQRAEEHGFASAWVSEAYGSDAVSVLAWLAGQTRTIGLGSAVLQVPARSAAATAMTAATLDGVSGGRFSLGLGVSGPQVSEGWHGVAFAQPLARTRAYVADVRRALAREPGLHGASRLRLSLPAPRPDLPLLLAAVGPKNVELAGEVADGWLPAFLVPEASEEQVAALARGRARCELPGGADRPLDVVAAVTALVVPEGADLDDPAVAAPLRAHTALYLGGMGSREKNVYAEQAARLGHGAAAAAVQDAYLSGDRTSAAALVPTELLRAACLLGTPEELRARLGAYAAAGVGTVAVAPFGATLAERLAVLDALAPATASPTA
ncbi:LLM class flavin-dependent oxidoreductase [Quadrisphaera setariae]|uniref:LLM class flavin-dependent oxidoreductase n=1 Tax=Quadrisphaera setariae TaxID=2593304 RepID=A0A5C8ZIC3_9ACTN|nr:LLM class flavin-dependent oxidoreductase [Quadrisphaera setariae]TXR56620.1 LLM class flavin-dependent oxidoreductase [Quadrisphaera setariae]